MTTITLAIPPTELPIQKRLSIAMPHRRWWGYCALASAIFVVVINLDFFSTFINVLVGVALLCFLVVSYRRRVSGLTGHEWKVALLGCVTFAAVAAPVGLGLRTYLRYQNKPVTIVPIAEFGNDSYSEDPADRSVQHGNYRGRELTLIQKDSTHFDFVFEPKSAHIAKVVFKNIDVAAMTPNLPEWANDDPGLRRIALTDRQWNRQQVQFDPASSNIEITGGDGFEKSNLMSVELAKNCLNAGLWEVMLFVKEGGVKKLYYHGWFTFPLGHYRRIFEERTGLAYWKHWFYLEHWADPAGAYMPMEKLRRVLSEKIVAANFDSADRVISYGEQARKRRTVLTPNLVKWADFYDGNEVEYATFIKPGRYSTQHVRHTEYWRMQKLEKAVLRDVAPAAGGTLQELELSYNDAAGRPTHFVVSGFDLNALPKLATQDYSKGLYMPMGIGVPPFFQRYDDLQKQPPQKSPYFSIMTDGEGKWIDHHKIGVDGPVLHLDEKIPGLLHVYLLSYERHTLVAHYAVNIR